MNLQELYQNNQLSSGWYYIQIGNYSPIIDFYDADDNEWLCKSNHDLYPLIVLKKVPSYDELIKQGENNV